MSDEDVRHIHNADQTEYFSREIKASMVPTASPYTERQIDRLVAFAGIGRGAKILEVGCGMGRYTLGLARRGFEVHGLDLVPFLLEKLAEYAGDRHEIPVYCTDVIEHDPALDGAFDAVVGFFALHHFFDLDASYEAMARMLKPGGVIVFLEPNAFNPLYYLQILLTPGMTWEGDRGILQMRKRRIFKAMSRAKLERPEVEQFGFFPPAVYNTNLGRRIDHLLERTVWDRVLPFQLFRGFRPSSVETALEIREATKIGR